MAWLDGIMSRTVFEKLRRISRRQRMRAIVESRNGLLGVTAKPGQRHLRGLGSLLVLSLFRWTCWSRFVASELYIMASWCAEVVLFFILLLRDCAFLFFRFLSLLPPGTGSSDSLVAHRSFPCPDSKLVFYLRLVYYQFRYDVKAWKHPLARRRWLLSGSTRFPSVRPDSRSHRLHSRHGRRSRLRRHHPRHSSRAQQPNA